MSMLCSFTTGFFFFFDISNDQYFFFLFFFFFLAILVCGIVSYGRVNPRFFCDWFMVTWSRTSVTSSSCRVLSVAYCQSRECNGVWFSYCPSTRYE